MPDPKPHRQPGTVVHFDPYQWDGQPVIHHVRVTLRTARKVFLHYEYADGAHCHGEMFVGKWDRFCETALSYPKARIEVPNG